MAVNKSTAPMTKQFSFASEQSHFDNHLLLSATEIGNNFYSHLTDKETKR